MQVIDTPAQATGTTTTDQTEAALLAAVAGLTEAVRLQQEVITALRADMGKGVEVADNIRRELDQLGDELSLRRRTSTSTFMQKAGLTAALAISVAYAIVGAISVLL